MPSHDVPPRQWNKIQKRNELTNFNPIETSSLWFNKLILKKKKKTL